jgi:TIR domain
MRDLLRIYVLWHPESAFGRTTAGDVAKHFDGLGMERDGVAYRVPVRFRSEPWNPSSGSAAPAEIPWHDAEHNAIVLLHDELTARDEGTWDDYVRAARLAIRARNNVDVYIPFQCAGTIPTLPSDGTTQYARQYRWITNLPNDEAITKRLLLHILQRVRTHLRQLNAATAGREPLFVSHAKADGDETAWSIINHVNSKDQDVPLDTFYDAKELMPGEDYQQRFIDEIENGTLLAIVSDIYDSRPWCVFELTEAKRKRRPIVLADVSRLRTTRTYPYGANLPRVRYSASGRTAIEALLVDVLSEGLRCDLFMRQAVRTLNDRQEEGLTLPRPPELFDLLQRSTDELGSVVVYPDPPIPTVEREIIDTALRRVAPNTEIKTLGELL